LFLAKLAAILENLGDFLFTAGRKLGGNERQPFHFNLGVRDGHIKDLQQCAGVVIFPLFLSNSRQNRPVKGVLGLTAREYK